MIYAAPAPTAGFANVPVGEDGIPLVRRTPPDIAEVRNHSVTQVAGEDGLLRGCVDLWHVGVSGDRLLRNDVLTRREKQVIASHIAQAGREDPKDRRLARRRKIQFSIAFHSRVDSDYESLR